MPGARTHDLITVITAAGGNAAYFTLAPHADPMLAVLFTTPYLFAGYACAGELDLDSKEYRRWGPLRFLWWPYQKLIPHRSPLSHGLVMGGLFRIFYLLCILLFLSWGGSYLYSLYMKTMDPAAFTRYNVLTLEAFVRSHPNQ